MVNALVLAVIAALIMGILPGPQSDRSPFERPPARVERPQRHPSGGALDHAGRRASGRGGRGVARRVLHGLAFVVARDQRARLRRGEIRGRLVAVPEEVVAVDANRAARVQREMTSRLEAEPGVAAVTWSSNLPGFASGARIRFEEGVAVTAPAPWDVSRMDVTLDMLEVYGAELAAGRRFVAGDVGAANTVLVNQSFAHWLAGDGNALGVRFRCAETAGQAVENGAWFEIVGIVRDFPSFPSALNLDTPAVVYHPAEVGDANPPSCRCDSTPACRPASVVACERSARRSIRQCSSAARCA